MTSPEVKAEITTGDINKLNNEHWGHPVQVLHTVSLPPCASSSCEDFVQIQDFFHLLGKDPSLIFRHWFTLKAPVNAIATLFEVIKPRKQRNKPIPRISHSVGQTRVHLNSINWSGCCTHTASWKLIATDKPTLLSSNRHMTFIQDRAPAHAAKATQAWCKKKKTLPNVIEKTSWLPNSPDINLVENLWSIMDEGVYKDPAPKTSLEENPIASCRSGYRMW